MLDTYSAHTVHTVHTLARAKYAEYVPSMRLDGGITRATHGLSQLRVTPPAYEPEAHASVSGTLACASG